jgi:hypothetical protein
MPVRSMALLVAASLSWYSQSKRWVQSMPGFSKRCLLRLSSNNTPQGVKTLLFHSYYLYLYKPTVADIHTESGVVYGDIFWLIGCHLLPPRPVHLASSYEQVICSPKTPKTKLQKPGGERLARLHFPSLHLTSRLLHIANDVIFVKEPSFST